VLATVWWKVDAVEPGISGAYGFDVGEGGEVLDRAGWEEADVDVVSKRGAESAALELGADVCIALLELFSGCGADADVYGHGSVWYERGASQAAFYVPC